MIEVQFESVELLLQQIGLFCLLPMLVVFSVFIMANNRGSDVKEEDYEHFRSDPFFGVGGVVTPLKPEPVISTKDMTFDIDKAINERVDTQVKCPYCGQKNSSAAMNCQQCGGAL